jgi:hypothetical protein
MFRRALIAAAPLVLFAAAPALAADKKDEKVEVGQYVDIAPVALPIVVDGQLVNYVFAYVRINLTSGANPVKLREKEPYFRDALVRAGHRTPFTTAGDYNVLDAAKLSASLTREAGLIAGPGVVKSVVITSQSPKKRVSVPKPKTAA